MLFLRPGTRYQIRFAMVDPDGGAADEAKIVAASTRSEPQAPEGGKTIHATPESGLAAAYEQAGPGDVILLHAGVYRGPFELKLFLHLPEHRDPCESDQKL